MFERFTDRARRVLVLAQEEARLLDHGFIGTEHILLGLIHEGEGIPARVLGIHGIQLDAVRERVRETIGPGGTPPLGSPPFTPRSKKVLELSLREALQLGHNYIGPEHMLLGLIREGEGVAAQLLSDMAGDLARVRKEVLEILGEPSAAPDIGFSGSPVTRLAGSQDAPACPTCRVNLADTLRYRTQDVPGDAVEGESLRRVVVFWCRACGRTLAVTPEAGPAPRGATADGQER